jgi:hypothetical protein
MSSDQKTRSRGLSQNDATHGAKAKVCPHCHHDISTLFEPALEEILTLADRIERYDRALEVSELAHLLSCSDSKLCEAARKGLMPAIRFLGSWRFDPKTTADWLRSLECGVAA